MNEFLEERAVPKLVVYVDVDDTLVRTVGKKRIPISEVVAHVRALAAEGADSYCWSSGGGEYAKLIATELKIDACFLALLTKPQVLVDDQSFNEWRRFLTIHPMQCESESVESYRAKLSNG